MLGHYILTVRWTVSSVLLTRPPIHSFIILQVVPGYYRYRLVSPVFPTMMFQRTVIFQVSFVVIMMKKGAQAVPSSPATVPEVSEVQQALSRKGITELLSDFDFVCVRFSCFWFS